MLKLTSYSSEKHLKDKLLIAIRHGAEGFSFSWGTDPAVLYRCYRSSVSSFFFFLLVQLETND